MKTSPSRPADRRVQTVCLLILTLIATAVALYFLQPVLVPFVLAVFFAQCLTPLIEFLMARYRWPQIIAVTVATLAGAAVVTGVGFLLVSSMSGMAVYSDRFQALGQQMAQTHLAHLLGIKTGATMDSILNLLRGSFGEMFGAVYTQATAIVRNTATVLILMGFLLFGRQFPRRAVGILGEIEERVQRYITLTSLISIFTGLFVGVTLRLLHVQFAAGFGFLAFLLNYIPNIGAVIATLLPLPLVFIDPNLSIVAKIAAMAIPALMQIGVGSFIQPRMMGYSLDLHPVVLLLSLIFFTVLWGVSGAFLATPLTAVIKIVFEKIPETRPLAALLAGDLQPLAHTLDSPENEDPPTKDSGDNLAA